MKCVRLSRASAITCSAGSPVRNASRPSAIASPKLDAAPPDTMPTLWTGSGPGVPGERLLPKALRAAARAARRTDRPPPSARRSRRAAAVVAERLARARARARRRSARCCRPRDARRAGGGSRRARCRCRRAAAGAPSSRARSSAGGSPRTGRGGPPPAGPRSSAACSNSSRCADTPVDHDANLVGSRAPVARSGRSPGSSRSRAARRGSEMTSHQLRHLCRTIFRIRASGVHSRDVGDLSQGCIN